jgi:dynein light chain LC8-type
MVEVQT